MSVNKYNEDEANTKFSLTNLFRMLKFLKGNYKMLVISLIFSFFASIFYLALPKILSYAIDNTIPHKNFRQLIILCILAFIFVILGIILKMISNKLVVKVKRIVSFNMKNEMFIHLQYLPVTFFDTRPHGKILTRLTTYADDVSNMVCDRLLSAIIQIFSLIFVLIFMLTTNVQLTVVTVGFAIIFFIIFAVLTPLRRNKTQLLNNKISNVNAYVSESINGMNITQSFNREKKNEEIYWELEQERVRTVKSLYPLWNSGWAIGESTASIVEIVIYLCGISIFTDASIGIIMAMATYSNQFWGPIRNLNNIYVEMMDSFTYLERIFELLDEPLVIENKANAKVIDIKGSIEFKNVSISYNEQKQVLDNVNCEIKPEEHIALVGETGAGKSTIVSLISRYYDVTSGSILIDGVDIKDIDLSTLRKNINTMLQDNYLFSRSIMENIKYANPSCSNEQVIEICKKLKIHDWILSLEEGYETILYNNGSAISTGQRQLLCFARTMLANPKILILDEATSNIDLKTEKLVQEGMAEVLKNRTSIIIAHRLSTIINCDRIFFVKDKNISESGTHKELMKKKGDYYKLYQAQIGTIK